MPVLILFFCSGATALIYEVIWSKYLALMFGSTIQAQTVVLAVFMGGLALGNRIFGGRADRARHPLALYGYLEVSIGLYAFFFSTIYKFADSVFVKVGSGLLEQTALLLALKGVISMVLLLGPTILMGGTLPVLAAWLQRSSVDAGRRSARFYSTNSLGAVCGAGLAGFFLVVWLGLPVTLQMTALANVLIGFTAVGIARWQGDQLATSKTLPTAGSIPTSAAVAVESPADDAALRWGCVIVALTGGVSMGMEVLASRCLSLIFGASLQAFSIVLMSFIIGIGVGAAVVASPRWKSLPKERTTIALLLGTALMIGLVVYNIEQLVEFYRYARSGLGRTSVGYRYHQVLAAVMSIAVLGLPAGALGAVLPLWVRVVSGGGALLGSRVGRLLTWNTLGAVAGVLLTGFVLMPHIGLRGSFGTLALVLATAALLGAWATKRRAEGVVAAAVIAVVGVVCATGGEGWRHVLSSGVFRKHETEVYRNLMKDRMRDVKILFYEDAPDATVSVEQGEIGGIHGQIKLRINGKVDASSHGDLSTQLLLAHLPLLAKPDTKEMFVFGMGSGITAGTALSHPIDHVTIAENCEPVLRAVNFFAPWNSGVSTNARTVIWREDARTVLKLSPQAYDVIIAEPSNPWMAGVGSVFSREFYQLAALRLKPGGIMTQWFHIYEMSDGIVELVLRTFAGVFPFVEVWDTSEGDLVMLGSDRPWDSTPTGLGRAFAREAVKRELQSIGIGSPEALLARQMASLRTGFALTGDGPIQLDDFPVLEYEAPKAFYMGQMARHVFNFDERTWQADLSPAQKRNALAALPDVDLKAVLTRDYTSVNQDLTALLRARFADGGPSDHYVGSRPLPSPLRRGGAGVMRVGAVIATNSVARGLCEAEMQIRANSTNVTTAVAVIESALKDGAKLAAAKPAGDPGYFAALAVKASLRAGRPADARRILLLGLKTDPASDDLQFVSRVLVREQIVSPEDLASASSVK